MSKNQNIPPEDRTMLRKMFNRSWFLFAGFNLYNFQGMGYGLSMFPAIRRFYANNEEKRKAAMTRAVQFFNCTYETAPFIMGLNAAMEKENAEKENFDPESINALKAALIGPFSAIGDTVFWGIVRVVAASIAIPLAQNGNILGPLLFLLIFHAFSILTRYNLLRMGYTTGARFLQNISDNSLLKRITYCISIVGMIMVGCLVAQFVNINIPLTVEFRSGEKMVVQHILDSVFKGLLGIGATFGCLALMRRKVKIIYIILGIFAVGILGALLGIFQ
ncbi:MAG: PTS system mannose/fructose/sorbose family transporter subunit IID [Treponema sp.]|jgi:mannose/fructose/N-acetylgalactosamine-specific phosphotransferase system component IID|nr:PTS system mannose/fructose/sorbose family transporter subunit IID [Treponema sp.]